MTTVTEGMWSVDVEHPVYTGLYESCRGAQEPLADYERQQLLVVDRDAAAVIVISR